jgi:hypothetical protein
VLCCYGTTNSTTAWFGQPWQEGKTSSGPVKSKKKEQREFPILRGIIESCADRDRQLRVRSKEKGKNTNSQSPMWFCLSFFAVLFFFFLASFLFRPGTNCWMAGPAVLRTVCTKGREFPPAGLVLVSCALCLLVFGGLVFGIRFQHVTS